MKVYPHLCTAAVTVAISKSFEMSSMQLSRAGRDRRMTPMSSRQTLIMPRRSSALAYVAMASSEFAEQFLLLKTQVSEN